MLNNIWGLVLGGGLPVFHVILVMSDIRDCKKYFVKGITLGSVKG